MTDLFVRAMAAVETIIEQSIAEAESLPAFVGVYCSLPAYGDGQGTVTVMRIKAATQAAFETTLSVVAHRYGGGTLWNLRTDGVWQTPPVTDGATVH